MAEPDPTAPNPTTPDPTPLSISFAVKSPDAPAPRWRDQAGVLLPIYGAMLLGFPFVWLLTALPVRLPSVPWILVIALAVFMIFAGRRYHGWDRLPKLADPARRIHVLLPPRALKKLGPPRDEAFEAEAVHDPMPLPDRWWDWLGIIAVMLAGGSLASRIPGMAAPAQLALSGAGAAGALGLAALGGLRQTWLRFSPGRLDVMVFRPWKPDAIRVQTYDLRTPRIVIDTRWRRLILGQGRHATTISLGSMFTVTRTSHLALQAAASTAPTPNLPPTRLTD